MNWLNAIATFVQIFGLPIAIAGIWLSMRNASRSHDVQVILSFVDSFRAKWEGGWADTLERLEASPFENADASDVKQLRFMLNWIDWVGRLAQSHVLNNEDVILSSLKPSLQRAIDLAKPMLQADAEKNGAEFWAGVTYVSKRLDRL